ncbi:MULTISPECIES: hypothetical protein [Actinoplanes]|uniref:Uncharacterized protein n=2 Tax=Actinoplanes TaxID=1865 RepID=A0A0X3V6N9_9ACTN|nr:MULTISPECIES: hypothetical protein [Actinoplanes]KUL40348.1 hypothetical protein ADL15_07505 [Actinoplanes awajinensis subsp. mycoplanecinus]GIE66097.1 hypothetical protein Apa02nite_022050 [Actinoplanes palleronii]
MTVRSLLSQKALHVESGVTLSSAGREDMALELGGHVLMIAVDRGQHRMRFTLPAAPRWDDTGEALPPEVAGELRAIITEIAVFWEQQPEFEVVEPG